MYVQGNVPDSLTCAVCFEVLREPVVIKGAQACTHSFCRECLVGSLDNARRCPTCRAKAPGRGR